VKKEKTMKANVGLWIDHKKAIVIAVTAEGDQVKLVISKAQKQVRRSGDSPMKGYYEPHSVPADNSSQRVLTEHRNIYYDAVIACLREADAILIFGPGEAKGELKKRLEKHNLAGRIAAVETVDKMSGPQIAAKVREFFASKSEASPLLVSR
jgi:hypothetical protein